MSMASTRDASVKHGIGMDGQNGVNAKTMNQYMWMQQFKNKGNNNAGSNTSSMQATPVYERTRKQFWNDC